MTDSIAERQQAELVGRLESIRVNNGYLSDLGANLYQERMHFSDDETLPLVNVQLVGEEVQSGGDFGSERVKILRTFRVEIWRSDADDSATALLQDVKRAVMVAGSLGTFTDDAGKLGALSYAGTEAIAPEQGGSALSGIAALFRIVHVETWGEPRTST